MPGSLAVLEEVAGCRGLHMHWGVTDYIYSSFSLYLTLMTSGERNMFIAAFM